MEQEENHKPEPKLQAVPVLPTKILKMESNILGWSLEMSNNFPPVRRASSQLKSVIPEECDMNDVELNLSVSMPMNLSIKKNSVSDQPLNDTLVFNALQKQGSCQSINQIAEQ